MWKLLGNFFGQASRLQDAAAAKGCQWLKDLGQRQLDSDFVLQCFDLGGHVSMSRTQNVCSMSKTSEDRYRETSEDASDL